MPTNFEKLIFKLLNEDLDKTMKARKEGRNEGRQEGKLIVAKELLKMKLSISDIEKATGLTEEEIKNIKFA